MMGPGGRIIGVIVALRVDIGVFTEHRNTGVIKFVPEYIHNRGRNITRGHSPVGKSQRSAHTRWFCQHQRTGHSYQ